MAAQPAELIKLVKQVLRPLASDVDWSRLDTVLWALRDLEQQRQLRHELAKAAMKDSEVLAKLSAAQRKDLGRLAKPGKSDALRTRYLAATLGWRMEHLLRITQSTGIGSHITVQRKCYFDAPSSRGSVPPDFAGANVFSSDPHALTAGETASLLEQAHRAKALEAGTATWRDQGRPTAQKPKVLRDEESASDVTLVYNVTAHYLHKIEEAEQLWAGIEESCESLRPVEAPAASSSASASDKNGVERWLSPAKTPAFAPVASSSRVRIEDSDDNVRAPPPRRASVVSRGTETANLPISSVLDQAPRPREPSTQTESIQTSGSVSVVNGRAPVVVSVIPPTSNPASSQQSGSRPSGDISLGETAPDTSADGSGSLAPSAGVAQIAVRPAENATVRVLVPSSQETLDRRILAAQQPAVEVIVEPPSAPAAPAAKKRKRREADVQYAAPSGELKTILQQGARGFDFVRPYDLGPRQPSPLAERGPKQVIVSPLSDEEDGESRARRSGKRRRQPPQPKPKPQIDGEGGQIVAGEGLKFAPFDLDVLRSHAIQPPYPEASDPFAAQEVREAFAKIVKQIQENEDAQSKDLRKSKRVEDSKLRANLAGSTHVHTTVEQSSDSEFDDISSSHESEQETSPESKRAQSPLDAVMPSLPAAGQPRNDPPPVSSSIVGTMPPSRQPGGFGVPIDIMSSSVLQPESSVVLSDYLTVGPVPLVAVLEQTGAQPSPSLWSDGFAAVPMEREPSVVSDMPLDAEAEQAVRTFIREEEELMGP